MLVLYLPISMIPKKVLKELVNQKLRDADVLLSNRRYPTAFYIAGYALEIALKLKVCKIFKFAQGFPEDKVDFNLYQTSFKHQKILANTITKIRDIRNHDLNKLLFYSGAEYEIKLNCLNEWNLALDWDPEMRYRMQKFIKKDVAIKIGAIKTLIENIL